jgi:hypothetical protein
MVDFFSQETRAWSAVFGDFRGKKRAKGREVQAPFSAKAPLKKSLSLAYRAVRRQLKYWQPYQ